MTDVEVYKNITASGTDAAELALSAPARVAIDKKTLTHYTGTIKGEERADYTNSFLNGTVDTRSTYLYSDSTHTNVASNAGGLSSDAWMTRAVTRRGELTTSTLKQISFYKNAAEGEEQTDYSIEYNFDGT